MPAKVSVFWFRRDLRLADNIALFEATRSKYPVLPIFIFDTNILDELEKSDARVQFIHNALRVIHERLVKYGSALMIRRGTPEQVWQQLLNEFDVQKAYTNRDYEPYALQRDGAIKKLVESQGLEWNDYKDQVVYEKDDVLKDDGTPYTVFTPYKRKWLARFEKEGLRERVTVSGENFYKHESPFPELSEIGFQPSDIEVRPINLNNLSQYKEGRDYPAKEVTSNLSPHLRFGTVSVRDVIRKLNGKHPDFLSELIWREFFMQVLFHFPEVVNHNFKRKYDGVKWRNDRNDFDLWCHGKTGYPIVDAGMRELNQTGYMHNRVRMVVASFLCKHLLIDWQWGEAYFAGKLLDYELSSNNGNWQWAAGTGCDAAPYFRIFNPIQQLKKFDPEMKYIKRWVPEVLTASYPKPMVEHVFARERALDAYKMGLE